VYAGESERAASIARRRRRTRNLPTTEEKNDEVPSLIRSRQL